MKLKTLALTLLLLSSQASAQSNTDLHASADLHLTKETTLEDVTSKRLLYTTYFYTAGEAIVHGYEPDTKVRIVSLAENRTVWSGTVSEGETTNVPTGQGVFAFLSEKKASILVGTPSSCTAVGYYVRDQDGKFLSNRFFTQLPSSGFSDDNRVIIWAWNDTEITVRDRGTKSVLAQTAIKAGSFHTIPYSTLTNLANHTLEVTASGPDINVQVYYDQGFHAPSSDGRVSGKVFRTYVGKTTEGHNDLNLINYGRETEAVVTDLETKEQLWKGKVPAGGLHSLRLSGKYVEVRAKDEISALVAPYKFPGYAEHHFAGGQEGTGIETSFMTTTPDQIWVFSYFDQNNVKISDAENKVVWEGPLNAGNAQGYFPGAGVFKVSSAQGISVMGGSAACGAEYSPAGGLFRIDEELFKVATIIVEARKAEAAKTGKKLTREQLNAPLSPAELEQAADYVHEKTGSPMSPAAVESRMKNLQTH